MTYVLEAQELKKYYTIKEGLFQKIKWVKALDGVSFRLKKAETLAIVGESGCGKSTLARLLTLIERPTSGQLTIQNTDVDKINESQRKNVRKNIQMIFQNPYGSLNPRKKIGDILNEPLLVSTALSKAERQEKIYKTLDRVGLRPEFADRYPHMFSGGQRQRVAIARALILEPEIIVADEPVSALDISVQAQILNLLMDLQEEYKLAYVFISHDLSVVRHIAHNILVMYLGQEVEYGDKKVVFDKPVHPYTQALMASTPHTDPTQRPKRIKLKGEIPSPLNPPSGCRFHKRCPFASDICQKEIPAFRSYEGRYVECHHAEEIVLGQRQANYS